MDADQSGVHSIEIIAEINHAPRMPLDAICAQAASYQAAGADLIDVGCDPGDRWTGVGDCVRALRDAGHRVSIDSLNHREIADATSAGAELVLSVNSSNRDAAADWGCEVVVIPDEPKSLAEFDETIELLACREVAMRLDPILEPIGCGFAASLGRYVETRRRYADAEMMMGIGNLTELTDVDSAGVNVLLLGMCEELGIRSVLTTQVINWARSSVRECDLARSLVHFAVQHSVPPKRVSTQLLTLRDEKLYPRGETALQELAKSLKDNNYRLFAESGELHLLSSNMHITSNNAFDLFKRLLATGPKNIDPSHAFYLGYELAKATTALTLGKQYTQDESLDWGYLTEPEDNHRQRNK
jgi:dihydropteroate synthase-like protein